MQERKNERVEMISADGTTLSNFFDLSKSGVGMLNPTPIGKGSVIKIALNTTIVKAKVVYSKKRDYEYHIGFEFWNILPQHQEDINELVEKYSKGVPINCRIIEE